MKSLTEESMTASTRPCRVCGEEIKTSARKCVHCGSYQDLRSHLSSDTTTILSLVVAIISLSITAIPVISNALKGESSNFSFSLQSPSEKAIPVFVSNSGARPGTIWKVELTLARLDSAKWEQHELTSTDDGLRWPLVIEAGSSKLFSFSYPVPHDNFEIPYDYRGDCRLVVFYTDFGGTDGAIRQRFRCDRITPFLAARDPALKRRVLKGDGPVIGPPVRVIPLVREQKYVEPQE